MADLKLKRVDFNTTAENQQNGKVKLKNCTKTENISDFSNHNGID